TTDQHGALWTNADGRWNVDESREADTTLNATGSGHLELTDDGGAGPLTSPGEDVLGPVVAAFTPDRAENALEVRIPDESAGTTPEEADEMLALGAPVLEASYSGTAPE